jgi:hypothetical protein
MVACMVMGDNLAPGWVARPSNIPSKNDSYYCHSFMVEARLGPSNIPSHSDSYCHSYLKPNHTIQQITSTLRWTPSAQQLQQICVIAILGLVVAIASVYHHLPPKHLSPAHGIACHQMIKIEYIPNQIACNPDAKDRMYTIRQARYAPDNHHHHSNKCNSYQHQSGCGVCADLPNSEWGSTFHWRCGLLPWACQRQTLSATNKHWISGILWLFFPNETLIKRRTNKAWS